MREANTCRFKIKHSFPNGLVPIALIFTKNEQCDECRFVIVKEDLEAVRRLEGKELMLRWGLKTLCVWCLEGEMI